MSSWSGCECIEEALRNSPDWDGWNEVREFNLAQKTTATLPDALTVSRQLGRYDTPRRSPTPRLCVCKQIVHIKCLSRRRRILPAVIALLLGLCCNVERRCAGDGSRRISTCKQRLGLSARTHIDYSLEQWLPRPVPVTGFQHWLPLANSQKPKRLMVATPSVISDA